MSKDQQIIPIGTIERRVCLIRGEKILLDHDLAELYSVETRVLLQAVKRNFDRFPDDFMFQLTKDELENWRSQIVMSNPNAKMGLRRPPYVGVAMLFSVLRSNKAIQVNIGITCVFVRTREVLATHKDLAQKIEDHNAAQVTAVINATLKAGLIKIADKEYPKAGYIPIWV